MLEPLPQPPELPSSSAHPAVDQAAERFLELWQRNLAAWAEGWPALSPQNVGLPKAAAASQDSVPRRQP